MEQLQYIIDRIDKMDAKYDDKLDKILYQTTKTNGRVTNLENKLLPIEKDVTELKEHKNITAGRDKTLWVLLLAAGAIISLVLEHFISKT